MIAGPGGPPANGTWSAGKRPRRHYRDRHRDRSAVALLLGLAVYAWIALAAVALPLLKLGGFWDLPWWLALLPAPTMLGLIALAIAALCLWSLLSLGDGPGPFRRD